MQEEVEAERMRSKALVSEPILVTFLMSHLTLEVLTAKAWKSKVW